METSVEDALAGDATGLVPELPNVGGPGAGAGSLPIKEGGSCDWVVVCDESPTRRGRVVDVGAPADDAESPVACAGNVRGWVDVFAGGDFLADCVDGPLG